MIYIQCANRNLTSMQLVVETIFQERTSVTNGLKWLPHRQSDIANVQQTELIYAILLQSVVKLPSVALWYQANSVLEPPSVTPVGRPSQGCLVVLPSRQN